MKVLAPPSLEYSSGDHAAKVPDQTDARRALVEGAWASGTQQKCAGISNSDEKNNPKRSKIAAGRPRSGSVNGTAN